MKINHLCLGLVPCLGSLAQAADYLPLTLPQAGERSEFLDRGLFQFFPRLSTGALYDDNVLLRGEDEVADLVGFLAPGMSVVVGDTASTLSGGSPIGAGSFSGAYGNIISPGRGLSMSSIGMSLDYGARLSFYRENSELNDTDHSGRVNFVLPLARGHVALEQEVRSMAETPVDLAARTRQTTYSTRLGLNHELGGFTSVDSSLNYTASKFEQGIGSSQLTGSASLNYRLSDLTSVGLGGAFGNQQVEDSGAQTFEQGRASFSYQATELISVNGSAGLEWRQYEGQDGSSLAPVFSLSAAYAPTERTRIGLSGARNVTSSAFLVGQNYVNTMIGASVSQDLSPRVTFVGVFSYNLLDYREADASSGGGARTDSFYSVNLQVNYLLAWRVAVSAFYGFRQNSTSGSGGNYSNNQVGFSLNWAY